MYGLIGYTHKRLQKLANIKERKIKEINNLEIKAEYGKSIKVLNRDRGNIVNKSSWKPLFCKINIVLTAILWKQSVKYCSSRMVGSYVISHRT